MMRTFEVKNRVLAGSALGVAMLFSVAVTGCRKSAPATAVDMNNGADPAAANMAEGSSSSTQPVAQVMDSRSEGQTTQQGESYQQQAAPIERRDPTTYATDDSSQYSTDVDTSQPAEYAEQPPPPLPVYEQPEAPDPDDLWTPGYWNYGNGGYYWVPGAWVAAPYAGALWTPPYWGFYGGRYGFHRGYWGLHIGFYGGIAYGFGYTGFGYEGGYWNHDHFYYNQSVNRVNVNVIHNTYNRNVTVNNNVRVSYNGGPGGLNVRPRPQEIAAIHEQHTAPMPAQIQHQQQAAGNRQQFFAENHGRPATVVAARTLPAEHVAAPTRNIAPSARPNVQEPARGGFGQQAQPGRAAEPQRGGEPQNVQPHNIQQPNQRMEPQRVEPQQQRQNVPEQRPGVQPQQARPQPQAQPQRVEPQSRPVEQPRPQPQPQARPAEQPHPQPQARPAEQPHPQPQARPAEQPHPQPQSHPEPAHEEHR